MMLIGDYLTIHESQWPLTGSEITRREPQKFEKCPAAVYLVSHKQIYRALAVHCDSVGNSPWVILNNRHLLNVKLKRMFSSVKYFICVLGEIKSARAPPAVADGFLFAQEKPASSQSSEQPDRDSPFIWLLEIEKLSIYQLCRSSFATKWKRAF